MSSKKRTASQRVSKGNRSLHSQNGSLALSPASTPSSARVTPDELTNLVNNAVYFILVADQHKRTITRADIVKNVLKDSSCSFAEVLKEARRKLVHVFGYELIDVKEKQGSYMLVSKMDVPDVSQFIKKSDEDYAKQGFVTLVLSLIMMMGGCVEEGKLWNLLASLGIMLNSPDAVFGNVKKWVTTDLVKQLYLDYSKVDGSEPTTYQFKWGPRARSEVPKKDLLDFVCEVHGDGMQPEQWLSVFNEINEEAQSKSQSKK
ncbi:non-structural maintenance of chromosomes element 3 homolog [Ornithodoros turicata]|uniref:non-structural maintenance of chromosomes element 3 homolog n=1 Tax=Ornithodoros turicata TaxID=34597 RepID=UPI003138FE5E